MKLVKPIDYDRLALMDDAEEKELLDKDCESGVCPVR
jgi:ribonucleoside-diphosphate reductase alpha chain